VTALLGGLGILVFLVPVGILFLRLERRGTSVGVLSILLGLLVVESALYADPNDVPVGLFHPEIGGLSFRIFDALIPIALAARLAVRRPARSLSVALLLWGAFLAWIVSCAVIGLLEQNPPELVTFQAKVVLYIGVMVLAMDVAPAEWFASRGLRRVVVGSSALAVILIVTDQSGVVVTADLPLVPLSFGPVGTDVATIFAVLGLVTLVVGACSDGGRVPYLALSGPMLATPLVAGQRAALLGLVVSVLAVLAVAPLAWRHVRATGTEVTLAAVAVATVFLLPVVGTAALGGPTGSVPLAATLEETFQSRGKQLSGQDRMNQWDQARALVAERPWLGWGLGKQYDYYSPGYFQFFRTDLTHNVLGDLMLRTGLVGVALFLAAIWASLADALLAWRRSLDSRVAALGLACFGALTGMVAKGMVESLFEKYRLAIVIGVLVGMAASLAYAWRGAPTEETPRRFRPAALPAGEALP
jgi:O-antigen ligase